MRFTLLACLYGLLASWKINEKSCLFSTSALIVSSLVGFSAHLKVEQQTTTQADAIAVAENYNLKFMCFLVGKVW